MLADVIGGQRQSPGRIALALALTLALGGVLALAAGLFAALPALLAFVPLLAGRYIGADRLESLIERRRRSPRPRAVAALRPRVRPVLFDVRGGRLIAASLAERPPPASPAPA